MSDSAPATAIARTPAIALPTGRLLAAVIGASLVVGAVWLAVALVLRLDEVVAVAGPLASIVVALCTAAGLVAIAPWRPRPVAMWVTLWLAQTLVRLLVTPALTFLVYSATPIRAMPLALAVGMAYLAAVVTEAGVVRRYLAASAAPGSA